MINFIEIYFDPFQLIVKNNIRHLYIAIMYRKFSSTNLQIDVFLIFDDLSIIS
jgi:hypothetical protein